MQECSTCQLYVGGRCTWPVHPKPFWLTVTQTAPGSQTQPTDGTDCAAYVPTP